jgi:hypothetical protein
MCDAEPIGGGGLGASGLGAALAPVLCALLASAVRGVTGFADGLTFQALWALAMAFGAVPSTCAAVRKGVLYSTVMQLVTLPIQAWATRAHLGTIRGYLLVMCGVGSCTVYVGAWLLLQDFALQLRLFAGAFFCLVAGAQLSLSARAWLDARADSEAAAAAAAAAPVRSGDAIAASALPADDWAAVAASPASSPAASSPMTAAVFAGNSAESGEGGGDGKRLVVVPAAAVEGAPAGGAAPLAAPAPQLGAVELFFASPRGRLWFPPVSPVLPPLLLLSVLGFASLCAGVLNGMLGAGGPPLMLAYSFLELDKDVLRGFGVVPSVFMVLRMILYVAVPNGVFDVQELFLYAMIGLASAGGSAVGGRMRASCSATALLRAILGLVWLSGVRFAFSLARYTLVRRSRSLCMPRLCAPSPAAVVDAGRLLRRAPC